MSAVKDCPECGIVNFHYKSICDNCGYNFNSGATTEPGTQSSNQTPPDNRAAKKVLTTQEHKTCPFCAETIKFAAIKCKHCGEFLDKDSAISKVGGRQVLGDIKQKERHSTFVRFAPHLLFFGVLFLVILLGVQSNSGKIGSALGILTAFAIDPLLVIGGLLIGGMNRNQLKLLLFAAAFGVIASIIIANMNSSFGARLTGEKVFFRIIAVLGWAYISNIFVLLKSPPLEEASSKTNRKPKQELRKQVTNDVKIEETLLPFKNNQLAFEYVCKYMDCTLQSEKPLPALVAQANEFAGIEFPVQKDENGIQTVLLKVASDDGGFFVMAKTPKPIPFDLESGDFVAWQPLQYKGEVVKNTEDKRIGWIGLIVAKLKPDLDTKKGWSISYKFE